MAMDELLQTAPCGFIVFRDDGTVTHVNKTLLNWLRMQEEGLKAKHVESIFNLATRIFYQTHFFPLITLHGKAEEIFLTLRPQQGDDIPVMANAIRKEEEGSYTNHMVLVQVHQRKKYEDEILQAKKAAQDALHKNEELINAKRDLETQTLELDKQVARLANINRELAELSSVISHDMQEPVRRIAMFADMVYQQNKDLGDTALAPLKKIGDLCVLMRNKIKGLNDFVTVEISEQTGLVNLNDAILRATGKVQAECMDNGIKLETPALPVIEGNTLQLERLFYHLVKNAYENRQPGNAAEINIESDIIKQNSYNTTKGRYRYIDFVRIVFSDKGMGFDDKYNEYVFRMFKKLDPASEGLGLGLAVCKKIVEHMYGTITAQSAPGGGARFVIHLPVRQG
jgi:sigma-B regulation protein RsbU (phosphoserine phosphatase)